MRPFTIVILTLISLAVLLGIGYAVISIKGAAYLRKQEESEARIRAIYGDDVIIN